MGQGIWVSEWLTRRWEYPADVESSFHVGKLARRKQDTEGVEKNPPPSSFCGCSEVWLLCASLRGNQRSLRAEAQGASMALLQPSPTHFLPTPTAAWDRIPLMKYLHLSHAPGSVF